MNGQQQPQGNQLQIKIEDAVFKGVYANMMSVAHAKEEFVIDFMNVFPLQRAGMVTSRVIVSPGHMKRILKAMQANPEALVLLNAGKDGINATKQAAEFGLKKKAKIVHALLFIDDCKAAGPEVFADDYVTGAWYWKSDNPGSKEFVEKWQKKFNRPPNWMNAATYSAVTQYLKAVERAGSKDAPAVIKALEGHKFSDLLANPGYIRPEDHMQVGKAYILRAKKPEEIKEPWDYFEIVGSIPAEEAYQAPKDTGCKMDDF